MTKNLRRLLATFAAADQNRPAVSFDPVFDGILSRSETAHMEDLTMRDEEAKRIIDSLDTSRPWYLRIDWIKAVASLANVHSDMNRMCPGPSRRIGQLLYSATAPKRSERYFNNIRIRHNMHAEKLSLFPVGTTSNESLRAEVNRLFKETQKLRRAQVWGVDLRMTRDFFYINHSNIRGWKQDTWERFSMCSFCAVTRKWRWIGLLSVQAWHKCASLCPQLTG